MKATGINTVIARFDAAEYGLCRRLNRGASFAVPRRVFQIASRLGDWLAWYALILVLPLIYGRPAAKPAIVMALTGALGVLVYALLKRMFVRERPFITHAAIDRAAGCWFPWRRSSPARAWCSVCTILPTWWPGRPSARHSLRWVRRCDRARAARRFLIACGYCSFPTSTFRASTGSPLPSAPSARISPTRACRRPWSRRATVTPTGATSLTSCG